MAFQAEHNRFGTSIFTGTDGQVWRLDETNGQRRFSFISLTDINDAGDVVVAAALESGESGIFTSDGSDFSQMISSPTEFLWGNPSINDAGAVAFSRGDGTRTFVAKGSGTTYQEVVNTDGSYQNFIGPHINNSGEIAFQADLGDERYSVFVSDGMAIRTVAETNDELYWFWSPTINDNADVAVVGWKSGGEELLMSGNTGLQTIADTDDEFKSFHSDPAINNNGTLDTDIEGIYVGPDTLADKVIATGDQLLGQEVVDVAFARDGFNDAGQVAFWAKLADGTEGVFRADPSPLIVITHGLFNGSELPDWVLDMASALSAEYGLACDDPENAVVRYDTHPDQFVEPADCSELLLFDWAEKSTTFGNADEMGQALASLVTTRLHDAALRDVHFIGFSRGGFVNHAAIMSLADDSDKMGTLQMTTLDPQGLFDGPTFSKPDHVDFADNYLQNTTGIVGGETIQGAVNVDLSNMLKDWGARDGDFANHSEVHDWYHWTIDKDDTTFVSYRDDEVRSQKETLSVPNAETLSCDSASVFVADGSPRNSLYPVPSWRAGCHVGFYWSELEGGAANRPKFASGVGTSSIAYTADLPSDAVSVQITGNPSPLDVPEIDLSESILDVGIDTLPGGSAELTLYPDPSSDFAPNSYYKYGPEPGESAPRWYKFFHDGRTGAEIFGQVVVLHLVDGEHGDDDLDANGLISDPGAVAFDPLPYHNRDNHLDVDRDTYVVPLDALLVINELNESGSRELPLFPAAEDAPASQVDVDGDGFVAPVDALQIINHLNAPPALGEGEITVGSLRPNTSEAVFGNRSQDEQPPAEAFASDAAVDPAYALPSPEHRSGKPDIRPAARDWYTGSADLLETIDEYFAQISPLASG